MNIPYCVLKEQKGISSKCYYYHQNLAKTLYKLIRQQMKTYVIPYNRTLCSYSKQKIYKWLFNLDFNKRLKVCSIYNNWFSKILFQLLTYNSYEESIKFFPTKLHENYYALFDPFFCEEAYDYKKNWSKNEENDIEKFILFFEGKPIKYSEYNYNKSQREKNFLKELKFITIDEYNDTITLSADLLNSREKLSEYFDNFTNCRIFEENILPLKPKKDQNIFNFSLPVWAKERNGFSIQEIIVICFEQIISVYYQISSIDNKFPEIELFTQIDYLLKKNKSLENYLSDSSNEEHIENIFNSDKLLEDVNSKDNKELMDYYENLSERIYEIAYNRKISFFYKDEDIKLKEISESISYLKKEYNKNIHQFVNTIFYIDSLIAFKTKNLVYNLFYQKIDKLLSEKNIDDLCISSPIDKREKNKNKKKNKKNKRNKRSKKTKLEENNSNEINSINTNNNVMNENGNNFNNINDNNNKVDNDYINSNQSKSINYINTNNSINNSSDNDFTDNESQYKIQSSNSKECNMIEMENLNEQGKKIKSEDTNEAKNEDKIIIKTEFKEEIKEDIKDEIKDENKNEEKEEGNDHIIEELKEIDEEKKKKKKRKNKKKNKKKENKKEEKKEDKNDNMNNIDNDTENNEDKNEEVTKDNINIKIDEIKDKAKESQKEEEEKKDNEMLNENQNERDNNNCIIEDNKNIKKKHKEFFLFPIEHIKKKKEKKIKIKLGDNNPSKKLNTKPESENENEEKSTLDFSPNTPTKINISERIESNENCYNDIKNYKNKNNNNDILIEAKVSKIEFTCKKWIDEKNEIKINENKIDDSIDDKNKTEYFSKFDKCQISNSNNPVINNYIILGKESFHNNIPYIENFEQNINNNIFVQTQNPMFSPNYYTPSPLPNFSYPTSYQLQNYYMNEQNEFFLDFNNEIISYEKNVNDNLEILKKYREQILNKIKDYIKEIMEENNYICELINYGSYETKLNIEISDIDVLIKFCKNNSDNINFENQYQVLSLIYNKLNKKKEDYSILSLNAIYTASVPVLKIKCNLENIIPSQKIKEIKNNYGLNIEEEILQLNFDFTFTEVHNLKEEIMIPCLEIVSYIKKVMSNYKEIKPLMLLLKRYMKINNINSSYTGGLSSYSLFLLVYAYAKSIIFSGNNLGQYLLGFLEFYSNLNFGIISINVNLNNPFILLNELHECGMMLIDPITNLNVAKSTFKVDQIKSVLTKGVVNIRNVIYQKMVESNNNYNNNINTILFLEELFKNRNKVPIIKLIDPL